MIVGERAASRLCTGYGVEEGGFMPTSISMTHPTRTFHRLRALSTGGLHHVFLRDPQAFHKCHGDFSRAPLNRTIVLFIAVLFRFGTYCKSVFPRCARRARESFD